MLRVLFIASYVFLLLGCTAAKTWDVSEPEEYLKVVSEEDTKDVEEAVKSLGISYFCLEQSTEKDTAEKVCYVEKTQAQKLSDFATRISNTSTALVDDTIEVVRVVGQFVLYAFLTSTHTYSF